MPEEEDNEVDLLYSTIESLQNKLRELESDFCHLVSIQHQSEQALLIKKEIVKKLEKLMNERNQKISQMQNKVRKLQIDLKNESIQKKEITEAMSAEKENLTETIRLQKIQIEKKDKAQETMQKNGRSQKHIHKK